MNFSNKVLVPISVEDLELINEVLQSAVQYTDHIEQSLLEDMEDGANVPQEFLVDAHEDTEKATQAHKIIQDLLVLAILSGKF